MEEFSFRISPTHTHTHTHKCVNSLTLVITEETIRMEERIGE